MLVQQCSILALARRCQHRNDEQRRGVTRGGGLCGLPEQTLFDHQFPFAAADLGEITALVRAQAGQCQFRPVEQIEVLKNRHRDLRLDLLPLLAARRREEDDIRVSLGDQWRCVLLPRPQRLAEVDEHRVVVLEIIEDDHRPARRLVEKALDLHRLPQVRLDDQNRLRPSSLKLLEDRRRLARTGPADDQSAAHRLAELVPLRQVHTLSQPLRRPGLERPADEFTIVRRDLGVALPVPDNPQSRTRLTPHALGRGRAEDRLAVEHAQFEAVVLLDRIFPPANLRVLRRVVGDEQHHRRVLAVRILLPPFCVVSDLRQRAVERHRDEALLPVRRDRHTVAAEVVAHRAEPHIRVAVATQQSQGEVLEQMPLIHLAHLLETANQNLPAFFDQLSHRLRVPPIRPVRRARLILPAGS